MLPLMPVSSPAVSARAVSGVTPMASTTMSARRRLFPGHKNVDAPVALFESLHGTAQCQMHAVSAHLLVDEGGRIGVEGVHKVARALHDGHVQPQLAQVLGHFQADETAAAHHGRTPGAPYR